MLAVCDSAALKIHEKVRGVRNSGGIGADEKNSSQTRLDSDSTRLT
jgi:hypothetical protein